MASQATGKGANLVGITDGGNLLTATNVEGALAELASKPLIDADNGRYQADFNWDKAAFVGCAVVNNNVQLDFTETVLQANAETHSQMYAQNGQGVRLASNLTKDIDEILYLEIFITKCASPTTPIYIRLFDSTSGVLLRTVTINPSDLIATYPASFQKYRMDFSSDPVVCTKGHGLEIRYDMNGSGTSSVGYLVKITTILCTDLLQVYTTNLWSTISSTGNGSLQFELGYRSKYLTGTVTKTVTPTDLNKWGSLKWTQTTPSNTNVICDVLDSVNNIVKAGVNSIADLSELNVAILTSVKIRWTLNRNALTDSSPLVSDPSVTYEGDSLAQLWKPIVDMKLSSDVPQVDFTGLREYKFLKIIALMAPASTAVSLYVRLDGDVANNYGSTYLTVSSNSCSGIRDSGVSKITIIHGIPSTADVQSCINLELVNTINGISCDWSAKTSTGTAYATDNIHVAGSSNWKGTKADKLSFIPASDTIKANSRFIIMGVKA